MLQLQSMYQQLEANQRQEMVSYITITNSTGVTWIANSMTISGDLFVNGTTNLVNTSTLSVEDTLVELGKVDGKFPGSDVNKDLGLVFRRYKWFLQKSQQYTGTILHQECCRFRSFRIFRVLTNDTSGSLEIALYLTDCK